MAKAILIKYLTLKVIGICLLLFSLESFGTCIGVITAGGGVDFWQHVEKGAVHAGKESRYKVIVRGPKNETDIESQKLIIEQMVSLGCIGLVVAPNSIDRVKQIHQLEKSGIKAVFIDRNFDNNQIHTIKTNNIAAGALAAKELIPHLPANAKIAVFRLDKHIQSTSQRETGFINEIRKAGLDIIVDEYIGTDLSQASLKAYTILKENPNIDGVFTPNESSTLVVLNMRRKLLSAEGIIHVGFDTHPWFKTSLSNQELLGVVIQKPFQMGYLGVKSVLNLLEGKDIPLNIDTPVSFINKDNLKLFDSE